MKIAGMCYGIVALPQNGTSELRVMQVAGSSHNISGYYEIKCICANQMGAKMDVAM